MNVYKEYKGSMNRDLKNNGKYTVKDSYFKVLI